MTVAFSRQLFERYLNKRGYVTRQLAHVICLCTLQLQVWFKNRRAKVRQQARASDKEQQNNNNSSSNSSSTAAATAAKAKKKAAARETTPQKNAVKSPGSPGSSCSTPLAQSMKLQLSLNCDVTSPSYPDMSASYAVNSASPSSHVAPAQVSPGFTATPSAAQSSWHQAPNTAADGDASPCPSNNSSSPGTCKAAAPTPPVYPVTSPAYPVTSPAYSAASAQGQQSMWPQVVNNTAVTSPTPSNNSSSPSPYASALHTSPTYAPTSSHLMWPQTAHNTESPYSAGYSNFVQNANQSYYDQLAHASSYAAYGSQNFAAQYYGMHAYGGGQAAYLSGPEQQTMSMANNASSSGTASSPSSGDSSNHVTAYGQSRASPNGSDDYNQQNNAAAWPKVHL